MMNITKEEFFDDVLPIIVLIGSFGLLAIGFILSIFV